MDCGRMFVGIICNDLEPCGLNGTCATHSNIDLLRSTNIRYSPTFYLPDTHKTHKHKYLVPFIHKPGPIHNKLRN